MSQDLRSLAHPAVHEAVVMAQPHPESGEEVTALQLPRSSAGKVRKAQLAAAAAS